MVVVDITNSNPVNIPVKVIVAVAVVKAVALNVKALAPKLVVVTVIQIRDVVANLNQDLASRAKKHVDAVLGNGQVVIFNNTRWN